MRVDIRPLNIRSLSTLLLSWHSRANFFLNAMQGEDLVLLLLLPPLLVLYVDAAIKPPCVNERFG